MGDFGAKLCHHHPLFSEKKMRNQSIEKRRECGIVESERLALGVGSYF